VILVTQEAILKTEFYSQKPIIMILEQIYTGCLAQGAYYIESDGEAAVIDPLREVRSYIEKAERSKAKIKYVFETHFHADFVSGHLDLARKTGAVIVYGPTAVPGFDALVAADGQEFPLGRIRIRLLHTPGHTMESSCFLLIDEAGKETALFTGDTLFIGDVGRPDLAQKVQADLTPERLAALLFDSLHKKILPLADDIIIYPAHGAGSACGKNMSNETTDTLGHQKATNYALQPALSKEAFIKEVLSGLTPPPAYFPSNVLLNSKGYDNIEKVMERGKHALEPAAFEAAANETNALILDTRDPEIFCEGHIPNSINIGINGNFAPWVGTLIPDIRQKILIVSEAGREEEVITRLARVGYDYSIGYLKGGFEAWKKAGLETDEVACITEESLMQEMGKGKINILDVRKEGEYRSEHVQGAENVPLDYVNENMRKVNRNQTYYVHCAGGYRSVIFISILKARGYKNLVNIKGGFRAVKESGLFKLTEYVRPATML
jgi:glyoxylase-like metal-dependent hydrolase (beta-lactamase superfamily II)/rhodanese-related sulfurtransferase